MPPATDPLSFSSIYLDSSHHILIPLYPEWMLWTFSIGHDVLWCHFYFCRLPNLLGFLSDRYSILTTIDPMIHWNGYSESVSKSKYMTTSFKRNICPWKLYNCRLAGREPYIDLKDNTNTSTGSAKFLFFWKMLKKKLLNIFSNFFFYLKGKSFRLIMENNFIQKGASAGHTVAYTIGPIFKHIDCVQLYFTTGFTYIVL